MREPSMAVSITHERPGALDLMIDNARRGHLSYSLPDAVTMVVDYVEVDPAVRDQLAAAGVDTVENLLRYSVRESHTDVAVISAPRGTSC